MGIKSTVMSPRLGGRQVSGPLPSPSSGAMMKGAQGRLLKKIGFKTALVTASSLKGTAVAKQTLAEAQKAKAQTKGQPEKKPGALAVPGAPGRHGTYGRPGTPGTPGTPGAALAGKEGFVPGKPKLTGSGSGKWERRSTAFLDDSALFAPSYTPRMDVSSAVGGASDANTVEGSEPGSGGFDDNPTGEQGLLEEQPEEGLVGGANEAFTGEPTGALVGQANGGFIAVGNGGFCAEEQPPSGLPPTSSDDGQGAPTISFTVKEHVSEFIVQGESHTGTGDRGLAMPYDVKVQGTEVVSANGIGAGQETAGMHLEEGQIVTGAAPEGPRAARADGLGFSSAHDPASQTDLPLIGGIPLSSFRAA